MSRHYIIHRTALILILLFVATSSVHASLQFTYSWEDGVDTGTGSLRVAEAAAGLTVEEIALSVITSWSTPASYEYSLFHVKPGNTLEIDPDSWELSGSIQLRDTFGINCGDGLTDTCILFNGELRFGHNGTAVVFMAREELTTSTGHDTSRNYTEQGSLVAIEENPVAEPPVILLMLSGMVVIGLRRYRQGAAKS